MIVWLDNASGRIPHKAWQDKLSNLEQLISPYELSSVCQWISENDDLKYDNKYKWLDSVFSRFLKSSKWYLNKEF